MSIDDIDDETVKLGEKAFVPRTKQKARRQDSEDVTEDTPKPKSTERPGFFRGARIK